MTQLAWHLKNLRVMQNIQNNTPLIISSQARVTPAAAQNCASFIICIGIWTSKNLAAHKIARVRKI
jgi:hypothetical protein